MACGILGLRGLVFYGGISGPPRTADPTVVGLGLKAAATGCPGAAYFFGESGCEWQVPSPESRKVFPGMGRNCQRYLPGERVSFSTP